MKKNKHLLWYAVLFCTIFFLDRVTKFLMLRWGDAKLQIAPFLSFSLSFNRGVSWGMFHSERSGPFIFVTLLTLAIIIPLFIHTVLRWKKGFSIWGESLALAGAISNFCDRLLYGAVVDFISFSYGAWSWSVFNVADACIVIGIFLILIAFSKEG